MSETAPVTADPAARPAETSTRDRILGAALVLIWFGLFRRRRLALTPFLLVQAFALVLVPLFWGSDVAAYRAVGAVLGVVAVVGIILALRPSVRAALH